MTELDRSMESALSAVLNSGEAQGNLRDSDSILRELVNIGYENQFSPEDRVPARKKIKEVVSTYLARFESNEEN